MSSELVEGEVRFDYEKSNFFRVIHVDGAVGAVSPANGFIHMSVFSERAPVPKTTVHVINQGMLEDEIVTRRVLRPGSPLAFREIEADLVLSVETAIQLRAWLDEKINEVWELTNGKNEKPV